MVVPANRLLKPWTAAIIVPLAALIFAMINEPLTELGVVITQEEVYSVIMLFIALTGIGAVRAMHAAHLEASHA